MGYDLNNIKRFVKDLKRKSGLDKKNVLEYSDLEKLVKDLKGEIALKKFETVTDGEIVFKDRERFTIFINENKNDKETLAAMIGHLFLHTKFFEEYPENYKDSCFERGPAYAGEKKEAAFFGLELLIDTDYFLKELYKNAENRRADINKVSEILGVSKKSIEEKGLFYGVFK